MELGLVGIAHHTAAVEAREHLALGPEGERRLLRAFHTADVLEESLVLDTCNRTEVLFVAGKLEGCVEYILQQIARVKERKSLPRPEGLYVRSGLDAARHLFRVAAALDSQIVGEHQVLAQVKAAYRKAVEERTASLLLNRLLHWTFRAAKRVQTETQLGQGSVSVASAAAALAEHALNGLEGKTVLLVGAGEMIQLAAKSIIQAGADKLIVANRSPARAERVAGELRHYAACGNGTSEVDPIRCPALLRMMGRFQDAQKSACLKARKRIEANAVGLEGIPAAIAVADLAVCCTSATEPVLKWEELNNPLRHRRGPVCIFDMGVPRNVEPRLGELPLVRLQNLDDLSAIVEDNLRQRRGEIPKAEAIVNQEAEAFGRWLASLEVTPTIQLLQRQVEAICRSEVRRYGKKFPGGAEQLEKFAHSLARKFLHRPLAFLGGLPQHERSSDWMSMVDVVRRMFELDDDGSKR